MVDTQRLKADLLALGVLAGTVYVGLCILSYDPADPPAATVYPARVDVRNIGGLTGAWIANLLVTSLGMGAYCVPALLALWDLRLFSREGTNDGLLRAVGSGLILAALVVGLQVAPPLFALAPPAGNGGYVGAWGAILLHRHFEPQGLAIVIVTVALAGLALADEFRLFRTAAYVCLLPLTMWDRLAFRHTPMDLAQAPDNRPVAESVPLSIPETVSASVEDSVENDEEIPKLADELKLVEEPTLAPIATSSRVTPRKTIPQSAVAAAAVATKAAGASPKLIVAQKPEPVRRDPVKVNPPAAPAPQFQLVSADEEAGSFGLPSLDLLDTAEAFPYEALAERAQKCAEILERTFQQFNLNVRVVEIDTGPVVTQYELELEPGLRLSKVTSLADDLAVALRVPSVRVVAPIPGKNTVGVEVPNDVRVMVRLRELIESSPQEIEEKRIPIFLGKDVRGQPLIVDMTKMPHLLIAGRTGTGKSVCLNTLILSMLMTRSPEQVKMLMIDPKMVELSPYMRIPHLMHPVITDMKKAEAVLGWAVDTMEERYDLLARVGVRHLDSYNKLGKAQVLSRLGIDPDSEEAEVIPETMPYIVIIADEMADMIMTSGKEVEASIIRLAQKSRAVGIHLVLATQKPTVDVITGLIKSNLPARIAFQVSSRMDSRVVLDEQGAEKLLGNGDMLYLAPGTSNLHRAQGSFVSDDEVMRVIEAFADQPTQYSQEIVQITTAAGKAAAAAAGKAGAGEGRDRDDLYDQAVEVVIREGRGSVSLLQRALGVGYGRGARMIDWMAEDGIVGGYNGSQAREVVMTIEDWEEQRAGVR